MESAAEEILRHPTVLLERQVAADIPLLRDSDWVVARAGNGRCLKVMTLTQGSRCLPDTR